MKKLILIRHGKSSWDAIVDDRNRAISNKGVRDAHIVSELFKEHLPGSFIVWSSPAKRAKETAVIFCQNLDITIDCILFKEELYTFEYRELEQAVRSCENEHSTLILFGHNNAITKFVNKYTDVYFDNVPTSGLVTIDFPVQNWTEIDLGAVDLTIFPRDLKNNECKQA